MAASHPLLADLVEVTPMAFPPDACREIVTMFEEAPAFHEHRITPGFRFTSVHLARWPVLAQLEVALQAMFRERATQYRQRHGAFWPANFGLEQVRLKRYHANNLDQFNPHVDVADYASARRFHAMLLYLNDVEAGGTTEFPGMGPDGGPLVVTPRAGTLLSFPPLYMFPHAGRVPMSGPKYVAGSYCHFG